MLAAGMGSRYGGLKQLDPVGRHGETILDYSVYDARRAGFTKVVFVIRREMEPAFSVAFTERLSTLLEVEHVFQELDKLPPGHTPPAGRTRPWGTTHALLMAAYAVKGPFAAINADDFYGAESYRVLSQFLRTDPSDHAMVGFVLNKTLSDFGAVSRGICKVDGEACLQSVVELTSIERVNGRILSRDSRDESTPLTGDEVVSMNMWGFTPRIFKQLKEDFSRFIERNSSDLKAESYLPAAVNHLLATEQARVKVLATEASWFGVTYREDQPRVSQSIQRLIQDGSYPERLWP